MDSAAEQTWLGLGGTVKSFRVREQNFEKFVVEVWELGGDEPRCYIAATEPTFATRMSVLNYRNILIAEACDRLVLFHKRGWRGGGGMTEEFARDTYEKPTYVYEAAA